MSSSHAIYPSLRGKTVLITGGAEGIGAATVELFTLQGCQVIFLDIAESSAQKTINSAVSRSQDAKVDAKTPIFYKCNVAELSQLQATVKDIQEKHGMVHILVNNAAAAGNRARLTTENVTADDWDFNVNTNLRHVFFLSQAVLPAMKEARSGSIINLGSITWRIPAEGTPGPPTFPSPKSYPANKHGSLRSLQSRHHGPHTHAKQRIRQIQHSHQQRDAWRHRDAETER